MWIPFLDLRIILKENCHIDGKKSLLQNKIIIRLEPISTSSGLSPLKEYQFSLIYINFSFDTLNGYQRSLSFKFALYCMHFTASVVFLHEFSSQIPLGRYPLFLWGLSRICEATAFSFLLHAHTLCNSASGMNTFAEKPSLSPCSCSDLSTSRIDSAAIY